MELSLIANTGIHLAAMPLTLDPQAKFKMWFHEWFDPTAGQWAFELVEPVNFEQGTLYYSKRQLRRGGYLTEGNVAANYTYAELVEDGIYPLADENMQMLNNVPGEIFKMAFTDRHSMLRSYENVWLPAPYFVKRTSTKFGDGPYNWARFKLMPCADSREGELKYNLLLAFDTRARYSADQYKECPTFPDQFEKSLTFQLCSDEDKLLDYCSPTTDWGYIDQYLFGLAHPGVSSISQLRGNRLRRMAYIATYFHLIDYLATERLFPTVQLFKDTDVEVRKVDMVVDIGNSRTTVLLREENADQPTSHDTPFTRVPKLQLTDYTQPIAYNADGSICINRHAEPIDMRLVFRKANFGQFGITGSKQFAYPSFVRLGAEANELLHAASESDTHDSEQAITTYSSPKRFLWDTKPTKMEWRFLTLPGEYKDNILNINGLTKYIDSDGSVNMQGNGGRTFNYSRRTLMTFAMLEMIAQARTQLNGIDHRRAMGHRDTPRRIQRIIVTCPTAMSKVEREALAACARDAVSLLSCFEQTDLKIEVVPAFAKRSADDETGTWYYDEATCAQLVYMYGEVGYKYRGCPGEFFNLYGKSDGTPGKSITLASLDIGAGTSDLMISKYTYEQGAITRIVPDPVFYDSFYFAGDDMLEVLIRHIMFMSDNSAFRKRMPNKTFAQFQQKMKDFVGPDHHGTTVEHQIMRRDFNLQYSVPLICHFLDLVAHKHKDCTVHFNDVFAQTPPNRALMEYCERFFGFGLDKLEWEFKYEEVCSIISKHFEPLLKQIAAIIFAHSCDIVILSGRPSSLPPIRDLLLKHYCVAPNRLIVLNDYFVGDWYPYDENTGYVVDSKPIVAVGAAIAYYASELSKLNDFIIDISNLQKKLESTVNFIEAPRRNQTTEHFITPKKHQGEILVNALPASLKARQIGMESYPARMLYVVAFDRDKMSQLAENRLAAEGKQGSPATISAMVDDMISEYGKRMPLRISIEREPDDKEKLTITEVTDRDDNTLPQGIVSLHIQSLGAEDKYWLDSGTFTF